MVAKDTETAITVLNTTFIFNYALYIRPSCCHITGKVLS